MYAHIRVEKHLMVNSEFASLSGVVNIDQDRELATEDPAATKHNPSTEVNLLCIVESLW